MIYIHYYISFLLPKRHTRNRVGTAGMAAQVGQVDLKRVEAGSILGKKVRWVKKSELVV
jgi:hypothetical protein